MFNLEAASTINIVTTYITPTVQVEELYQEFLAMSTVSGYDYLKAEDVLPLFQGKEIYFANSI